ncbi:MAG: HlyD family efflux transporter periplasmic adaptor subunit [Chitinophagales bacterium]|nr:HlyD family efflux transporter periplasmic adaptor subunit [Chitinophagales bacterium]
MLPHSDDILDILNESPRWIVRMGATVISFILVLFLAGTWYIRYPEILKGTAVVSPSAPTIQVVTQSAGRLMRLLVTDGQMVKKGDVLAEMENLSSLDDTRQVERLLEQGRRFLKNPAEELVFPTDSLNGGDFQSLIAGLQQTYHGYRWLVTDSYYGQKLEGIQRQIVAQQKLLRVNAQRKVLNEAEFKNVASAYQTDQKLMEEGLYSKTEFLKRENEYLEKKRESAGMEEYAIQNQLSIARLESEYHTVLFEFESKKRDYLNRIMQTLHQLDQDLQAWKHRHLLTAPSDGKLVCLKNLAERQYVSANEALFSVLPEQREYLAMVEIPVRGLGKAAVGQRVVLKMDDYPYQEFGTLEGQVVAMTPSENIRNYRLTVALPKGLTSSYQQPFYCKSEMAGTAEVVTQDLRLLERLFYGIRKLFM